VVQLLAQYQHGKRAAQVLRVQSGKPRRLCKDILLATTCLEAKTRRLDDHHDRKLNLKRHLDRLHQIERNNAHAVRFSTTRNLQPARCVRPIYQTQLSRNLRARYQSRYHIHIPHPNHRPPSLRRNRRTVWKLTDPHRLIVTASAQLFSQSSLSNSHKNNMRHNISCGRRSREVQLALSTNQIISDHLPKTNRPQKLDLRHRVVKNQRPSHPSLPHRLISSTPNPYRPSPVPQKWP
jgi:hypothetical protein